MATAILVDGGFYRKRAAAIWGQKTAKERADELIDYCHCHLAEKDGGRPRELYRIFYYDCPPIDKNVFNPLTGKNENLGKSDTFRWASSFLDELVHRRKGVRRSDGAYRRTLVALAGHEIWQEACWREVPASGAMI